MFCSQCGSQNPDSAQFCGGCGAKVVAAPAPPAAPAAPVPQAAVQTIPAPVWQAPPPTPNQYAAVAPAPQYRVPGMAPPAPPVNYYGAPRAYVPSHIFLAIVTTILFCMPLGIVSIIMASKVNSRLQAGDIAGAQRASTYAKVWALVGVVLGVGAGVLVFVALLLAEK